MSSLNLTAPIQTQTSYGLVALNILRALDQLGVEVCLWPIGQVEFPPECRELIKRALGRQDNYQAEAPSLRIWHQFDLAQHVGCDWQWAFPIFELDTFTAREKHHLGQQDLIFVTSKWAQEVVVRNGIDVETVVAPLGVDAEIFSSAPDLSPPQSTITRFFNAGKWEFRKHEGLCESFNEAFEPEDDVQLTLLCHNPFYSADENRAWAQMFLGSKMGRAGKIKVIEGRFQGQREVASLMAEQDCGVFPSKAEGWNLELAEMLRMGKHCIASNCTGHTEYCRPEYVHLIEMGPPEPAWDSRWFYGQGKWPTFGAPQKNQLIGHLRAIHHLKQSGHLKENAAGREALSKFSWERTAQSIVGAL